MTKTVQIEILHPGKIHLNDLTYVVIGARQNEKWIFVRHQERDTWELPAGHIETGESAEEAAQRELYEETGTKRAEMTLLHDYSVSVNGKISYGRIFFANVIERGPKPISEIAENRETNTTPLPATYPEAHKKFMEILEDYITHESK